MIDQVLPFSFISTNNLVSSQFPLSLLPVSPNLRFTLHPKFSVLGKNSRGTLRQKETKREKEKKEREKRKRKRKGEKRGEKERKSAKKREEERKKRKGEKKRKKREKRERN